MKRIPLLALTATLAGCAYLPGPGLAVLPAFETSFEDRVWLETGPEAAPGALRAFLSDGTMLTGSCAGTYRLAPWRRVDPTTLVWEDENATVVRVEIAAVGPREFALVVDPDGAGTGLTFTRATAPVTCP